LAQPLADLVADCLDVVLSRSYGRSRAHPLSLFCFFAVNIGMAWERLTRWAKSVSW
jgi:hypothetical protein